MTLALKHRVLPKQAQAMHADLQRLERAVAGDRRLGPGDEGLAVAALQRTLRGLDLFDGKITGKFEGATQDAVRRLEQQLGVPGDGRVDAFAIEKLRAHQLFVKPGLKTPARIGQTGADITALEEKLRKLSYATGQVDGVYDAKTAAAVRAFQKQRHLPATGIATASMLRAPFRKIPVPHGRSGITATFGAPGRNQVTTRLPLGPHGALTNVTLNKKLVPTMRAMLADAKRKGLLRFIHSFNGMFNFRHKRSPTGQTSSELSTHSWGIAFDINAGVGGPGGTVDPRLAALFQRYGFVWGKAWGDPMHFQYATGY
jgi:peptidoglycan hydrolase-like protein with peptidoglycan-binding domain